MLLVVSCSNYETVEQHGIIVDVEYHPAHTTMQTYPIKVGKITTMHTHPVRHAEYWKAHVHYEDSICVYENYYQEVHQCDSVKRSVVVRIKK